MVSSGSKSDAASLLPSERQINSQVIVHHYALVSFNASGTSRGAVTGTMTLMGNLGDGPPPAVSSGTSTEVIVKEPVGTVWTQTPVATGNRHGVQYTVTVGGPNVPGNTINQYVTTLTTAKPTCNSQRSLVLICYVTYTVYNTPRPRRHLRLPPRWEQTCQPLRWSTLSRRRQQASKRYLTQRRTLKTHTHL